MTFVDLFTLILTGMTYVNNPSDAIPSNILQKDCLLGTNSPMFDLQLY